MIPRPPARTAGLVLALAVTATACVRGSPPPPPPGSGSPPTTTPATPVPGTSPPPAPEPGEADGSGAFLPRPDAWVPRRPGPLAAALTRTTTAVRDSVEDWLEDGDPPAGRPPRDLALRALYQQRIYRHMARDPDVAEATIELLPPWLRPEARALTEATAAIFSLVRPISGASGFRTGPPEPAGVLMEHYREAERRFGVSWAVLASINHFETKFGRVRSTSSAGARGPMQFIPSTWEAYGMGGDVNDPRDAIMGAANYLRASGAPEEYRNAVYNYNHAWPYVDAVLLMARQMERDPRDYYAFHSWQVFVITTRGDVRLSGPGLASAG